MKKILGFIVATIIPIVGFLLASQRDLMIVGSFLQFELATRYWLYLGFGAMAVGLYLIVVRQARQRLGAPVVGRELRRFRTTRWPLLVVLGVAVLWTGARYLGVRYRYFSEIHHQIRAISALEAGDLPAVWAVCEDYLWIYPQRAESGAIPDPVCLPLLDGRDRLIALREYVGRVTPVPDRIDGVLLPADTLARRATIQTLDTWIRASGA